MAPNASSSMLRLMEMLAVMQNFELLSISLFVRAAHRSYILRRES